MMILVDLDLMQSDAVEVGWRLVDFLWWAKNKREEGNTL
jgi:hypothetical protein